jgi:Flp pilus assembly protein TadG
MGIKEGIVRARRGAVLAEFAIAFMPICAMFLCVAQLSRLFIARLATYHAAELAVRACAVIQKPDPGHDASPPLDGQDTDVQKAAAIGMAAFGGDGLTNYGGTEMSITAPQCNFVGKESNGGTDEVTTTATFNCMVPLASRIVCGNAPKTWDIKVRFPHQGANYKL